MRYEEIPGFDDIIGGANGKVDKAKEDAAFLEYWSMWLVDIINAIVGFFKEIFGLLGIEF